MRRAEAGVLLVTCLLFASGCAPRAQEHLPVYPWKSPEEAIRIMAARARQIQTVSSECSMTLTRPDGQSVRLEGAVALSSPDKSVRIRTWKFNQAVFDLTLNGNGLWLELPHENERRSQVFPAGLSAGQFARALSFFGPEVFDNPRMKIRDTGTTELELVEPLENSQTLIIRVDRPTLTARQYFLADANGHAKFTLGLREYASVGPEGIVWPLRMVAINDGSQIDVELRNMQINVALPSRAFVPPRGAEKVP
jgi:outer membrane lipoprotein-sorting protein